MGKLSPNRNDRNKWKQRVTRGQQSILDKLYNYSHSLQDHLTSLDNIGGNHVASIDEVTVHNEIKNGQRLKKTKTRP